MSRIPKFFRKGVKKLYNWHLEKMLRFKDSSGALIPDCKKVYYMKITDVRIRKIARDGKMKAVVSITLDDEFVVHDIKVIEGEKGLFIAMPSRRTTTGEYKDIAHPINSQTREQIQEMILNEYQRALTEEDLTEYDEEL